MKDRGRARGWTRTWPVSSATFWVLSTGIVFMIVEQKSDFVRFHARQSTITFMGLFVIKLILVWIPLINLLIFPLWILALVLWLLLMIKALQGQRYRLPIVGKMAEGRPVQ